MQLQSLAGVERIADCGGTAHYADPHGKSPNGSQRLDTGEMRGEAWGNIDAGFHAMGCGAFQAGARCPDCSPATSPRRSCPFTPG